VQTTDRQISSHSCLFTNPQQTRYRVSRLNKDLATHIIFYSRPYRFLYCICVDYKRNGLYFLCFFFYLRLCFIFLYQSDHFPCRSRTSNQCRSETSIFKPKLEQLSLGIWLQDVLLMLTERSLPFVLSMFLTRGRFLAAQWAPRRCSNASAHKSSVVSFQSDRWCSKVCCTFIDSNFAKSASSFSGGSAQTARIM